VTSIWQAAEGLDRAVALLSAAPTLTAAQHRALAGGLATIAQRIATVSPDDVAGALRRFASDQLTFGAQWARAQLAAASIGDWNSVVQVRQVAGVLTLSARTWETTAPDAAALQALTRAAQRLPVLGSTATDNLRRGFADKAYLVPDDKGHGWGPAAADVGARVKVERAASVVDEASAAVATQVGRRSFSDQSQTGARVQARDLLRARVEQPLTRSGHPSIAPAPVRGAPVGRRR
jgi:hypothetical protein